MSTVSGWAYNWKERREGEGGREREGEQRGESTCKWKARNSAVQLTTVHLQYGYCSSKVQQHTAEYSKVQ